MKNLTFTRVDAFPIDLEKHIADLPLGLTAVVIKHQDEKYSSGLYAKEIALFESSDANSFDEAVKQLTDWVELELPKFYLEGSVLFEPIKYFKADDGSTVFNSVESTGDYSQTFTLFRF